LINIGDTVLFALFSASAIFCCGVTNFDRLQAIPALVGRTLCSLSVILKFQRRPTLENVRLINLDVNELPVKRNVRQIDQVRYYPRAPTFYTVSKNFTHHLACYNSDVQGRIKTKLGLMLQPRKGPIFS